VHGRRGLDNADIPIHSVTHAIRPEQWNQFPVDIVLSYLANAFYYGDGVMYYGDGLPPNVTLGGQRVHHLAGALDIVAHELTHGVTDYSSGLIYQGQSGALNEAFSDIMGAAVEFMFQPEKADYLCAEDVFVPGGIRSMQNPTAFGDPDHMSILFTGAADNGGVHINSGIANHAFYLAIEGGRHRLGATVQGVGAANRVQIERVFYRAFTAFLVPNSSFVQAKAATIQAARELYGSNPAVEAAVTQAWNAVGVGAPLN
jgi:thermolysin